MSTYRELAEQKLAREITLLDEEIKERQKPPPKESRTEKFFKPVTKFIEKFQISLTALVAISGAIIALYKPIDELLKNKRNAAKLQFDQQFIASVDSIIQIDPADEAQTKRLLFNLTPYDNKEYVAFFMNELLYHINTEKQDEIINKVAKALLFRIETARLLYSGTKAKNTKDELLELIYERNRKFFDYYFNNIDDTVFLKEDISYRAQMENHIKLLEILINAEVTKDYPEFNALVEKIYTSTCAISDDLLQMKQTLICILPTKEKCVECGFQ